MKNIQADSQVLLIGIGNINYGDEGLGWRFVEEVESSGYTYFDLQYRSRLRAEDAALISEYDIIIFAVATDEKLNDGFAANPCFPGANVFFSTHTQAPGAILNLCNSLYEKFPKTYVINISGEHWQSQPFLSEAGERNLQSAVSYFIEQFLPVVFRLSTLVSV